MRDDRETTHPDHNSVLAAFGCHFADGFRRPGGHRVTVVLPGEEPHEYRVFVCEDAEEAAACLHRHGWRRPGRTR